jgi:methionine synthase / methylenetetrahydrofolate reductase(NADPH)
MDLLDELQTRILCGDGAMGTLLMEAGFSLERCFEELCVKEPDRITTIHEQYIGAGARVIETNSFGANAVRLERFGLEGRAVEINRAAARVACAAARGKDVYVTGSVGPLGLDGKEALSRGIDRGHCFREQITGLLEGGADIIFFETFMDCEEMEIAFQARKEVAEGLTICSFSCAPEGEISPGMSLGDAFAKLCLLGSKIMGVNCMNGPEDMVQLVQRIPAEYLLAAYPTAGSPKYQQGRFSYDTSPDCFAQSVRELVAQGVRLVGGCCGSTPKHVAAIAAAIEKLQASK